MKNKNEKGLLIILSGPSGVGKETVRTRLMKIKDFDLVYSVSMTTREPRNKEVDGINYYFVTQEEFKHNIEIGNFLEYAKFVGNYYGTPMDKVEALRNEGHNVLLEIEINGASQVMSKVKDDRMISFFLMPPSLKALEERIRNRKTESEEVILERLNKGKEEMTKTQNYDYVILNDRINRAAEEIKDLIDKKLNITK
ncbi:MAG: guanylate kinase [Bacilli bacterium]|nr:guanylate kinase [Bacilli bacterium]